MAGHERDPIEIAKLRDDAIRRALNTSPQPLKEKPKKQHKAASASAAASKPVPPEAS